MASNTYSLSVDSAIKLVTSMMRDPMRANICSERFAIAADRIEQALEACDSVLVKTKLVKSHPELLRQGIKLLTFKQSEQDFRKMIEHLTQCCCDFGQKGMRRLHTPSKGRTLSAREPQPRLIDAMATVAQCIILALSEPKHKFRTGNSSNGEQPWPLGPEDLLPFGPKDSVAGLDIWASGLPNAYFIFELAGCLAVFYAPFGAEVFQYPYFTFAMARSCQHLESAIAFYQEGNSSLLAREHFFTSRIKTIFRFFDYLFEIDIHQFHVMIMSFGGLLKPILTPLTTILSTLPPEWSEIRAFVSHITSNVYAEADPTTGIMTAKYDFSQLIEAVNQLDMLAEAFSRMGRARKHGCWNVQCSSHTETIHSRLCSRCSLIRFCGEKCQKDAWKYDQLPHKALCAKIYSLKEAFGSANWSRLWTPDFKYAQFQAMCQAKNVHTDAVIEIGDELSALTFRRRTFVKMAGVSKSPEDQLIMKSQEMQAGLQILRSLRDQVKGSQERTILSRGLTRRSLVPAFTIFCTTLFSGIRDT